MVQRKNKPGEMNTTVTCFMYGVREQVVLSSTSLKHVTRDWSSCHRKDHASYIRWTRDVRSRLSKLDAGTFPRMPTRYPPTPIDKLRSLPQAERRRQRF